MFFFNPTSQLRQEWVTLVWGRGERDGKNIIFQMYLEKHKHIHANPSKFYILSLGFSDVFTPHPHPLLVGLNIWISLTSTRTIIINILCSATNFLAGLLLFWLPEIKDLGLPTADAVPVFYRAFFQACSLYVLLRSLCQ